MQVDERIKNIKIYVDGKSAEIQKVLFALGAKWTSGGTEVKNYGEQFLFVDDSGEIRWSDTVSEYFRRENREVKASEVLKWKPVKPKPVLKPFDRVLVRDDEGTKWDLSFYGYEGDDGEFYVCDGSPWYQCIPYDGNEHLLGTTDSPEE